MRSFFLFMLGLTIGLAAGQKIMAYSYDPVVLEVNSLAFAASAYALGCAEAEKPGACHEKADGYLVDMTEIFNNQIWERH